MRRTGRRGVRYCRVLCRVSRQAPVMAPALANLQSCGAGVRVGRHRAVRSEPGWAPGLTGRSLLRTPVGPGEEAGPHRAVRSAPGEAPSMTGRSLLGAPAGMSEEAGWRRAVWHGSRSAGRTVHFAELDLPNGWILTWSINTPSLSSEHLGITKISVLELSLSFSILASTKSSGSPSSSTQTQIPLGNS